MIIKAKPIQWETVQLEDGAIKYGGDRKAGPEDEFGNHFDYTIGVLDDGGYMPHHKLRNRKGETLCNYVIGLDDAKQLCQIHKNQCVAQLVRLADINVEPHAVPFYQVTELDMVDFGWKSIGGEFTKTYVPYGCPHEIFLKLETDPDNPLVTHFYQSRGALVAAYPTREAAHRSLQCPSATIDQTNDYYFVTNEDLNAWGLDPFMDGTGTELWLPRTWSKAVSSFNRVGLKWAVNYMDGSRKVYSVHSQIEAEAMFKTEMEGQQK